MSSRKRADSLKTALPLPTGTRPQAEEEVKTFLNFRDSGIVLLSLTQSRQAWTTSILKKFSHRHDIEYKPSLPENTNPIPQITSLGKCHITVGPHTFFDTRILEVVYEKEEPPPNSTDLGLSPQLTVQTQQQSNATTSIRLQPQQIAPNLQPAAQSLTQTQTPSQSPSAQPQVVIQQQSTNSQVSTSRNLNFPRVRSVAPTASSTPSTTNIRPVAPAPLQSPKADVISAPGSSSSAVSTAQAGNLNASTSTSTTASANAPSISPSVPASNSSTQATPQLTAFMQTVLQSVHPNQILALQALLRQQQSGIPLSLEQRNALLQQLTALHQLLSTSQQFQPQSNTSTTSQVLPSNPPPIAPATPTSQAARSTTLSNSRTTTTYTRTPSATQISRSNTSTKTQRQTVRHEVIIEFRENKYDRWLFPKDAILEILNSHAPFEVLASFYLPQGEEKPLGSRQKHQAVTMQMTHVSHTIWDALCRATNDVSKTYQSLLSKTPFNPSRVYMQYRLPCDYPEEILDLISQRVSRLDGTLQIETVPIPSTKERKRKGDKDKDEAKERGVGKDDEKKEKGKEKGKGKGKEKEEEIDIEEILSDEVEPQRPLKKAKTSKAAETPKKSKYIPDMSSPIEAATPSYGSSGANKRCAYCGCKTTPMWRRGPDGAGTLCNACGVKWKQGKILGGTNTTASRARVAQQRVGAVDRASNEASDAGPVNQRGKRKLSLSAPGITLAAGLYARKKSTLSLSEEGALSFTDDDEGVDKTGNKSNTTVSQKGALRGRRTSTSSKKGANSKEIAGQSSSASGTILGGELAESPDPTTPSIVSPSQSPQYTVAHGIPASSSSSHLHSASTVNNTVSSTAPSEYPISLKLVSIAFGPNNACFIQPNCSVALHENFIKIKLNRDGYEKTTIDIWKESIEDIEFVAESEAITTVPLLTIKALVAQYLTRFDQELLNPDRNETLVIMKCLNTSSKSDGSSESKDLQSTFQRWLQQS